jgi:GxxExxY protein
MDLEKNEDLNQPTELFEITEKIIGCAYTVSNSLGCGFLEKVYENALSCELQLKGLKVVQQNPIEIYYKDVLVGEYIADLLVESSVLVELRAAQGLDDIHYAQCLNYLRATGLGVCLLLNFGKPELQIRRISARKEWAKNN